MSKIFFLIAVGLGTIGALAAPVQQVRALNLYDVKDEIRDYALVRRGKPPIKEEDLIRPRRPGYYVKATDCGYIGCCQGDSLFSRPGAVDAHWIQWHEGIIPPWWREPKTVPVKNKGRARCLPVGETTRFLKSRARLAATFPEAHAHVIDQRIGLRLYTGHMFAPAQRPVIDSAGPSIQQAAPSILPGVAMHPSKLARARRKELLKTKSLVTGYASPSRKQAASGPSTHQAVVPVIPGPASFLTAYNAWCESLQQAAPQHATPQQAVPAKVQHQPQYGVWRDVGRPVVQHGVWRDVLAPACVASCHSHQ